MLGSSPSAREDTTARPFESFYIWFLSAVGLSGLLVLCIWLSSIPKSPPEATVTQLLVPTAGLNGSLAVDDGNSSISYTVEIHNPNKESGIYYDDILMVFLLGDDTTVGDTTVRSFYQGEGKTHKVKGNIIVQSKILKGLVDKISTANAELKMKLRTRFRFKTWGKKSKYHGLDLNGSVSVGSDGKIVGKKKKIKLHHAFGSRKRKFKRNIPD